MECHRLMMLAFHKLAMLKIDKPTNIIKKVVRSQHIHRNSEDYDASQQMAMAHEMDASIVGLNLHGCTGNTDSLHTYTSWKQGDTKNEDKNEWNQGEP